LNISLALLLPMTVLASDMLLLEVFYPALPAFVGALVFPCSSPLQGDNRISQTEEAEAMNTGHVGVRYHRHSSEEETRSSLTGRKVKSEHGRKPTSHQHLRGDYRSMWKLRPVKGLKQLAAADIADFGVAFEVFLQNF